jgi:amino acid transporter
VVQQSTSAVSRGGHAFGTFGGVFTPAILTIFGVIMFMRVGLVVGQAGLWDALLILLIAKSITFFTSLSVGAIATNTRVGGGGAYFLISRALGPEFGGAIGLALYMAQALSVPFYILGFVESVVRISPQLQPHFMLISLSMAALLGIIAYVGAKWALRVQFVILALLVSGIVVMLIGQILLFDRVTFNNNMTPMYEGNYSFWIVFAIFFPAVTGIMAGINMSGDLKDPARSIPLGTLAAVLVSAVVYGVQILLSAGALLRENLTEGYFRSLVNGAPLKLGPLVIGAMFAASLSSAVGSYVGAPRVLQALSKDGIVPWLRAFAKGTNAHNEPRRALLLTGLVTFGVLVYAGNNTGGGALNAVAAVITMFFLYTYGMTNLAAFVEAFTRNPSFRPRFKYFHYLTALAGVLGCGAAALLINVWVAVIAALFLFGLFIYVRRKDFSVTFGDARRGFYYANVRDLIHKLAAIPSHPKNWRPTVMVFSGNPTTRLTLVCYATWIGCGRGIVTIVEILRGDADAIATQREEGQKRLQAFIDKHDLAAFPEVVAGPEFDQVLPLLLQAHSIGPLKPNLIMFGWADDPRRAEPLARHLHVAISLGRSIVVLRDHGLPAFDGNGSRIDIWWRGRRNGSLMLILAYLIALHPDWDGCTIRLLRQIRNKDVREAAESNLQHLIDEARVPGIVCAVVSDQPFADVLHEHSAGAACVMLGFDSQILEQPQEFHARYQKLLESLPTTLLVCSSGEADIFA